MKIRKKESKGKNFIPITRHTFSADAIKSVADTIRSGWLVQGPKVAEFEKLFCKFTSAPYAVATTSCTTALHMSLVASGIKKGDMVVVPAFTFVATANAVEYTGARPLFCDIDPATFNISVGHLEELLKKYRDKIKVVIPVHLFGLCADMFPILKLSAKYGFKIIEDAACALGAYYYGKHCGTFGMAGCFSFHPRKIITTGEGGVITVPDRKLYEYLRSLREHGASVADFSRHKNKSSLLPFYDILGYNYRMTDIQAALGISQMHHINEKLRRRRQAAVIYNKLLKHKKLKWLIPPSAPAKNYSHSYQSYVCRIDENFFGGSLESASSFRDVVMRCLANNGIATRQGTHAVHLLGYYRERYGLKPEDYPAAMSADKLTLALPIYSDIKLREQRLVAELLLKCAESLGY